MNKIEKLNNFISDSPQGTIFTTPEWLEAVAPGKWEYLTVESGNSIKICMPIILSKKFGFTQCNMPPFTQSLGILFPPGEMTCERTKGNPDSSRPWMSATMRSLKIKLFSLSLYALI